MSATGQSSIAVIGIDIGKKHMFRAAELIN